MAMIIEHPAAAATAPMAPGTGRKLVTLLFWMAWIYLWLPLLTFAAWALGFYRAQHVTGAAGELAELERLGLGYATGMAIFGGVLLLWLVFIQVRGRNRAAPEPNGVASHGAPEAMPGETAVGATTAIPLARPGVLRRISH